MVIAQGTANDDPRVYRPNSMYEVPIDLYTLYAAYDDNNVYLMWDWQEKLNRIITISTNGANGPWVYSGDNAGLNSNAIYGPAANAKTNTQASGIKFK